MPVCPQCLRKFKHKHSCKVGTCKECDGIFKNIANHRCPVVKFRSFDKTEFLMSVKSQGIRCDACGEMHALTMQAHRIQSWKGIDLCCDCFNIAEIRKQITERQELVCQHLINKYQRLNLVECVLCAKPLLTITGKKLASYELDHIDLFNKRAAVSTMIRDGTSMSLVLQEVDKCRPLCVPCHRAVTRAERDLGLHRLKTLAPIFVQKNVVWRQTTQTLVNNLARAIRML